MRKTKETLSGMTTGVKDKARTGARKMKKSLLTLKDRAVANMEVFLRARKNK